MPGRPLPPGMRPPGPRPVPQNQPPAQPAQPPTPPPVAATVSTVLVVDDHRIVREGLRQFVAEVPGVERVVTAASGEEALARFEVERPDLVLMDIQMPGMGGLDTTRRILERHPRAVVIMLTAADDRENVANAVAVGARGYLNKDVSHEELCAAVATALAGQDLIEPTLRRAMEERVAAKVAQEPGVQLTERELQVLQGMSQGRSNAEIGRSLFLSEDTIKTHARRLFRKLGVNDRAQAVALGFRQGFVR
jgi:DNA-binding NarL/FixJ family response regulator